MSTRSIPTPTPQDFARDFPEMAAGMTAFVKNLVSGKETLTIDKAYGPAPITKKTKSLESLRLEQGSRELMIQMEAQGWMPAMVINLNPWPIKVNGVLHTEILPACEFGEKYSAVCIGTYQQDTRDRGDGNWTCHAFVPMQLAQDFIEECKITKWGGVFYYPGRMLPDDPHMPQELKERVQKEWRAAEKKQLSWARACFNLADRAYNQPNGDKRIIGDLERKAALWLLSKGYIKEKDKPRWVDATNEEAALQVECPGCRKKADPQAIACGTGNCTYVFRPYEAYINGMVLETHPSLKRLPQRVLNELGLEHIKSIAHLPGVTAAPLPADKQDPLDKFAETGELATEDDDDPNPPGGGAAAGVAEEVDEEELERLTRPENPPDMVAESEQGKKEPATPKGKQGAGKKEREKPKSEQQKKAEETLE